MTVDKLISLISERLLYYDTLKVINKILNSLQIQRNLKKYKRFITVKTDLRCPKPILTGNLCNFPCKLSHLLWNLTHQFPMPMSHFVLLTRSIFDSYWKLKEICKVILVLLQARTKHLRKTPVLTWNSTLQEKFSVYFQGVFC